MTNISVDDPESILIRLRGVRISESPQIRLLDYESFQLYLNGECLSDDSYDFAFDGSVFFDKKLISNYCNCDAAALRQLKEATSSRPGETVGCFCLLSIERRTREFLIQFDPLTAYPCFIWRGGNQYAVSNNLHFINAIVSATGAELTRTVLPYLGDFALGSAYDVGSPYKEVEVVGPHESLRGGRSAHVIANGIDPGDACKDASYEEVLAYAAQRLRNRVDIIAEMFDEQNVFFDLTGGMDSRIVLAAVVARVPRLKWDYRTLYDYPHPDGHCATFFGEKFGLGRVYGIPGDLRRLMTALERMRFETFASMGVGSKMGWTISLPYPDIAHIHGGYGEIAGSSPDAKRFLSQGGRQTYQALTESYLARLVSLGVLRYFTLRGIEWLRSLLVSRLGTYEEVGLSAADAPVHYYNCGRLRSHFGIISRLRAQHRNYIDLLYDMYLQSCALKTDPILRTKGKVNFDLIRLVGGDAVAGLPMANDQWDASLFATQELRSVLQQPRITSQTPKLFRSSPDKRRFKPSGSGRDMLFRPRRDFNLPKYDINQVEVPFRGIFWRQMFLSTYLPETRSAPELEHLLDWDEIASLLSAPANTVNHYPAELLLQALSDCVIWHQQMELSVFA